MRTNALILALSCCVACSDSPEDGESPPQPAATAPGPSASLPSPAEREPADTEGAEAEASAGESAPEAPRPPPVLFGDVHQIEGLEENADAAELPYTLLAKLPLSRSQLRRPWAASWFTAAIGSSVSFGSSPLHSNV
ncbi:MAG: hypothetical protein AB8H86_29530 [Polyangiales bacterium]